MVAVVRVFSTTFCALPAANRVEPDTTSGPTGISMVTSATVARSDPTLFVTPTTLAPRSAASVAAAQVYGVRPLAVTATSTSAAVIASSQTSAAANSVSSSAASVPTRWSAPPPATRAWMRPSSIP